MLVVVDILTQMLHIVLTFIVLLIFQKISICRGWFLFGASYY